jgi:hypothetical protein
VSCVLRMLACVCIGLVLIVAVGCGGSADCGPVGVSVSPNTATADHTAASPHNQQQFFATNNFPIKQGCAAITAAILNKVTWSTSDPGDVSISNTQGSTYGVATCISAVSSPVTITATRPRLGGSTFTGTASLTCK